MGRGENYLVIIECLHQFMYIFHFSVVNLLCGHALGLPSVSPPQSINKTFGSICCLLILRVFQGQ